MGYTHYFSIKSRKSFNKVLPDIKSVVKKYRDILQRNDDDSREPLVDKWEIFLNGIGDDGHDTFCLSNRCDDFCKTDRKAYDLPVCIILLILKAHYGKAMVLGSDGFSSYKNDCFDGNWDEAFIIVRQMGYNIETRIEPRKDTPYFDCYIDSIEKMEKGLYTEKQAMLEVLRTPHDVGKSEIIYD